MTVSTTPRRVREDYTVRLRTTSPLSVGGAGGDAVVDMPLATDGQGRLVIPGSTWAGVLRAFANRMFDDEPKIEAVFGPRQVDGGHASRLTTFDSPIPGGQPLMVRSGVGIDRRSGTAAPGLLYDRVVVPPGRTIDLHLRYEGPTDPVVEQLLSRVAAVGLRVGASTGRGLGRLECIEVQRTRAELDSRSQVLSLLAGRTRPTTMEPSAGRTPATIRMVLTWRPRRPVIVGDTDHGVGLLPSMTHTTDGTLVPVLPGTSVKGTVRSTAERVVRTLLPGVPEPDTDAVASMDALAQAVPVLEFLFGSRRRAGALGITDTIAHQPAVGQDDWQRYTSGQDTTPPTGFAQRTHVAIDRWTGGAADGLLYTVLEPAAWSWSPIELELDTTRLRTPAGSAVRAGVLLLGVVLAELVEGGFGFGHATGRGLGDIEVQGIAVHGTTAAGLPDFTVGGDWWSWLRDVAQGRALDDLLLEVAPV